MKKMQNTQENQINQQFKNFRRDIQVFSDRIDFMSNELQDTLDNNAPLTRVEKEALLEHFEILLRNVDTIKVTSENLLKECIKPLGSDNTLYTIYDETKKTYKSLLKLENQSTENKFRTILGCILSCTKICLTMTDPENLNELRNNLTDTVDRFQDQFTNIYNIQQAVLQDMKTVMQKYIELISMIETHDILFNFLMEFKKETEKSLKKVNSSIAHIDKTCCKNEKLEQKLQSYRNRLEYDSNEIELEERKIM